MTFQALKYYSIYFPYCTVQYFSKFYISLNESLSPDALLVSVCFLKTSAYTITCFFYSKSIYGQLLLWLKNNDKVHLHLISQYEKNDFFWIQYGKILDGHVVQIKDAHWMNLLDVE